MGGRLYDICSPCKIAGVWVWLVYDITFGRIRQELICTISSLSRSAFLRHTEPDTGLIYNFQVSSIVPHFIHQNLIY